MAQELVVGPAQPQLETAADESEQRHPSAVQSPVVRGYVAGVVITGATVSTLAVLLLSSPNNSLLWLVGLPVLIAAYLIAEAFALNVEVRKGTVGIPLIELPLAVALLYTSFSVALVASIIALLARAAWRRRHWLITTFNLGASSVEIATAFLVTKALIAVGAFDLVAIFCGMVAAGIVGGLNAVGLSTAISGVRADRRATQITSATSTMNVVAPLMVVVGVQMLRTGPPGWLLLGGVLLMFLVLYRAYSVLLRERKDLDLVQAISAGVSDSSDAWPQVTELIRQQFNAKRVVVRAPDTGHLSIAGEELTPEQYDVVSEPDAASDAAAESVKLLSSSQADPAIATAVRARGASEVVVATLGTGAGAGAIELHDRQSQFRGFGPADIRLLETLSRYAVTAVDNRRLVAALSDAAYHDRLTGLTNRLGFTRGASDALAGCARLAGEVPSWAVLMVQLGAIGQVNDALGHGWGDRLVFLAAERVGATVARLAGPGTLMSRLEGDTFAVFLSAATERSEQVAEELAAELAMPYPMEDLAVEASPAIGVAIAAPRPHEPAPDVEEMLQQADVAMQAARAAGQPVRTYHPSMGQVFLRRFQLVTQFRSALDNGEVTVHYQPKLSLSERRVIGSEALMRWTHPEFGPVDPEELVQVLEATGLIDDLTRFVLDDALLRCRTLLDGGVRIDPAVNVSVRNLLSPSFPGMVASALAKHRVPAEMLTLEITETSVMGDAEHALPALRVLHEMGVMLSVDDFGTGYSSLSYLRRLPVDEVKIDKSFVLGMGTDLGDLAVVRAIIDLGRSLGLRVVAEGVETDVVRDQLAEMGCDVVQGYLIARAMTPERFDSWLHARTVSIADASGHDIAAPRLSS